MVDGASVFNQDSQVNTVTTVPGAGTDNHTLIRSTSANTSSATSNVYLPGLDPGQYQSLISSDDRSIKIQKSLTVRIGENQQTIARGCITTESETNQVHIKAATLVTLEVGQSKLIMTSDGTIELIGVNIKIDGDILLSRASIQNTVIGGGVDINP